MNIDQQLHDFEEMGTRDDCISERTSIFDDREDDQHVDRLDVIRRAAESCREKAL